MAGGPGVLETPTYICSAVFAVFLLLSLIIDKVSGIWCMHGVVLALDSGGVVEVCFWGDGEEAVVLVLLGKS